jgi:hypothetical protein
MAVPIRYPAGISTAPVNTTFGNLPVHQQTGLYEVMDDFKTYTAAEWTVRATTTNCLQALSTNALGVLSLTAPGALSTSQVSAVESASLQMLFTSVQQVWFETRVLLADVTNSTLLAGLTAGTTAVIATPPTDGIWFSKAAAATAIVLNSRTASGTAISTTVPVATGLFAANTYIRLGFYYNGKNAIDIFVNGSKVASQTTLTQLPVSKLLSRTIGTSNGATATAATCLVDYVYASQERPLV